MAEQTGEGSALEERETKTARLDFSKGAVDGRGKGPKIEAARQEAAPCRSHGGRSEQTGGGGGFYGHPGGARQGEAKVAGVVAVAMGTTAPTQDTATGTAMVGTMAPCRSMSFVPCSTL